MWLASAIFVSRAMKFWWRHLAASAVCNNIGWLCGEYWIRDMYGGGARTDMCAAEYWHLATHTHTCTHTGRQSFGDEMTWLTESSSKLSFMVVRDCSAWRELSRDPSPRALVVDIIRRPLMNVCVDTRGGRRMQFCCRCNLCMSGVASARLPCLVWRLPFRKLVGLLDRLQQPASAGVATLCWLVHRGRKTWQWHADSALY